MQAFLELPEFRDALVLHLLPKLPMQSLCRIACCCRSLRAIAEDRDDVWRNAAASADGLMPSEAAVLILPSATRSDVLQILQQRSRSRRRVLNEDKPAFQLTRRADPGVVAHIHFSPDSKLIAAQYDVGPFTTEASPLTVYDAADASKIRSFPVKAVASSMGIKMSELWFAWGADSRQLVACPRTRGDEGYKSLLFVNLEVYGDAICTPRSVFEPGPGLFAITYYDPLSSRGKHAAVVVESKTDGKLNVESDKIAEGLAVVHTGSGTLMHIVDVLNVVPELRFVWSPDELFLIANGAFVNVNIGKAGRLGGHKRAPYTEFSLNGRYMAWSLANVQRQKFFMACLDLSAMCSVKPFHKFKFQFGCFIGPGDRAVVKDLLQYAKCGPEAYQVWEVSTGQSLCSLSECSTTHFSMLGGAFVVGTGYRPMHRAIQEMQNQASDERGGRATGQTEHGHCLAVWDARTGRKVQEFSAFVGELTEFIEDSTDIAMLPFVASPCGRKISHAKGSLLITNDQQIKIKWHICIAEW